MGEHWLNWGPWGPHGPHGAHGAHGAHGILDPWILDPWIHGSKDPWVHRSMDPGTPGHRYPSVLSQYFQELAAMRARGGTRAASKNCQCDPGAAHAFFTFLYFIFFCYMKELIVFPTNLCYMILNKKKLIINR